VIGLTEKECESAQEVLKFFSKAGRYRTTATTMMNDHSSRSHAIFTVTIEQSTLRYTDRDGNPIPIAMVKSSKYLGGNKHTTTTMSRLNLVDLAGFPLNPTFLRALIRGVVVCVTGLAFPLLLAVCA
jgi:hypothetical protein